MRLSIEQAKKYLQGMHRLWLCDEWGQPYDSTRCRNCDSNDNCLDIVLLSESMSDIAQDLYDTFEAIQQENEQLRTQVMRMRETLEKAREALANCIDALELCSHDELCKIAISPYDMIQDAKQALEEQGDRRRSIMLRAWEIAKLEKELAERSRERQNKENELETELAHYKQEAEKIPDICYRYRYDPDECVHNDECPKICPKRNGGRQG